VERLDLKALQMALSNVSGLGSSRSTLAAAILRHIEATAVLEKLAAS
jgi:hypothetical protein